jgi:hypothetical protein
MTPLKNGAIINLEYHKCALRCDAYQLPGYGWALRVNNQRMPLNDDPDFKLLGAYDEWFDEEAGHGTMLVPMDQIAITAKFMSHVGRLESTP